MIDDEPGHRHAGRGRGTGVGRRAALLGGLAGLGTVIAACTAEDPAPSRAPAPPSAARAQQQLAALERRFGGRLGVSAVDTGNGTTIGHRADERFLMCSTSKLLAGAAILELRTTRPGLLERRIRYDASRLVRNSPTTAQHLADGLTVSELCRAAITVSDNTAMNLLLDVLGGPPAVTAYVRTLGDTVTRLDRTEPELNATSPGDERDTSTPAQMSRDVRLLALGDGLDPQGRDLLHGWLDANTTGATRIEAGLPAGWGVADKTGSGDQGEVNDVAVVRPPGRAPLVMSVYTAPADPAVPSAAVAAVVAGAGRILAAGLVPG